jgi:predicted ester cyclase
MSTEQNKAIARRIFDEVESNLRMDVIDDYFATDYVGHYPGRQIQGIDGLKEWKTMLAAAHTDHHVTVQDILAEGDKVVVRWSSVGTLTEAIVEHGAPPSVVGKQTTNTGITIMRFAGDKVAEYWQEHDPLGMWERLGYKLVPPPEEGDE